MGSEVREFDGRRLAQLRRAADLNRDRLAAVIGRTAHLVGRWERGEATPSLESVLRLASALGCRVDDLISPASREAAQS